MSKVDWSLAPEWATHALVKLHNPNMGSVSWSCFTDGEHRVSPDGLWFHPDGYRVAEERPRSVKPKPWSGPEDGLPPVGMTVELWRDGVNGQHVEIVGHFQAANKVAAYVPIEGARIVNQAIAGCFQPINSKQQLRETAIRELMDIAQVDCRVTAARLVDAGFKMPSKAQDRDAAVNDLASEIGGYYGDEHSDCSIGQKRLAAYLHDQGFKREVV